MTDKITYKDPTQEQLKLMQDYADICSQAIDIILKCEPNDALKNASARIQESMGWFHSYVINGGALKPDVVPAQKEMSPTEAARIVTLN